MLSDRHKDADGESDGPLTVHVHVLDGVPVRSLRGAGARRTVGRASRLGGLKARNLWKVLKRQKISAQLT